jgi:hypothetical protein
MKGAGTNGVASIRRNRCALRFMDEISVSFPIQRRASQANARYGSSR